MKKNKLLFFIFSALILGLIAGFIINKKITSDYVITKKIEKPESQLTPSETSNNILHYNEVKQCNEQKKKTASYFSILSDIFLHLIKMIISPLVLSVLIVGVAKLGDFKSVGRIGLKTLIYFTSATLIALLLGLILVNVFEPGKVMHLPLPDSNSTTGVNTKAQDAKNFIDHVIPESIIRSMASNDVLPIVVFSIFFGIACATIGSISKIVIDFFESLSHIMFKITDFVMRFAPIGVFGAITAVVIQQGIDVLQGYVYLILCFFGGLLFFVFIILFGISVLFKINFKKLMRDLQEPILLAFSTASSESAMPKTIEALEKHGISNRIVSFVLPLGYSFNLDGSIMYMTFATIFIAQSYGIEISTADQIKMMLILLLTSKGMAGVPRASLVVIAGMLATFKIPGEGLLLLLAVDQILDMGRSATNVVGNAVASAVIAKLEGEKF
ncbi:MAG: dicarboxylate/amino acid:cation symporter [Bacteroidetes bacterium]|nr:dicarboxylate/amino acid:cation symporter [Bacteroidota bacterium]